jgi:hypothetical protein
MLSSTTHVNKLRIQQVKQPLNNGQQTSSNNSTERILRVPTKEQMNKLRITQINGNSATTTATTAATTTRTL